MPTIHITLLGRFEVTVDAVRVAESSWTRRHAAALVKVLAIAPGKRLHREQVVDLVWPDDTMEEAVPKLHRSGGWFDRMRRELHLTRAESTLGWDDACPFCSIMLWVPASIACARVGDLPNAQRHLAEAERSAALWVGTSWETGMAEAQAVVAAAGGDLAMARMRIQSAAEQLHRVGQPLDAERCRNAEAGY